MAEPTRRSKKPPRQLFQAPQIVPASAFGDPLPHDIQIGHLERHLIRAQRCTPTRLIIHLSFASSNSSPPRLVAARPASAERIETAGSQMSVFLTGGPCRRPHVLTNSFIISANPATAPIGRAIWRVGRLYRCQPQTPEAFSNSLISSDNFLWHGTC